MQKFNADTPMLLMQLLVLALVNSVVAISPDPCSTAVQQQCAQGTLPDATCDCSTAHGCLACAFAAMKFNPLLRGACTSVDVPHQEVEAACGMAPMPTPTHVRCDAASATASSISVAWSLTQPTTATPANRAVTEAFVTGAAAADVVDVELSHAQGSDASATMPFLSQTTAGHAASLVLGGLLPATSYVVTVRAHNASSPSLQAGWSQFTAPIVCNTTAGVAATPTPVPTPTQAPGERDLQASDVPNAVPVMHGTQAGANAVASANSAKAHAEAHPNSGGYGNSDNDSDNDANGSLFLRVYRWSEGTNTVDFLENHDAGDLLGESVYVTDASLYSDIPGMPPPIGWGTIPWPNTTLTEYCVEMAVIPSPPAPRQQFAEYRSCNVLSGDGALPSEAPVCQCAIIADRLIAHNRGAGYGNNLSHAHVRTRTLAQACPGVVVHGPKHTGGNDCECTNTSAALSERYVGMQPVIYPWFKDSRYVSPDDEQAAVEKPELKEWGRWFHFPRGGRCNETQRLGDGADGGCTWRRLPRARVIRVQDVYDAGMNRTLPPPERPNDVEYAQPVQNSPLLQAAFDRTAKLAPGAACCGPDCDRQKTHAPP